ncbi:hypothetical protein J0J80_09885 [Turicibacter bilis]|uniref:hypothetical protein n=1 Tax=Turicibacter bilis TaxID=2735723 RepID=UPI001BB05D93|nr:hypothetical protein [Turicibacter bilis]MBS3202546.1 hypothetical protein [Turicibacter bilis]UUF10335.1 hypothetical protein J0J80_09885 [Turicibacter bilis]
MVKQNIKLKEMTMKQRFSYFWDYYRYHVIGAFLILVLMGTVIQEVANQSTILLNVVISEMINERTDVTELEQQLTQIVKSEAEENETIRIYAYPFNNIESSFSDLTQVYLEKFVAQVAISELDVFILEENDFSYFYEQGLFKPLDELLQEVEGMDSSDYLLADEDHVYAIRLDGNKLLEDKGIETKNKVVTVLSNSLRQEESADLILALLNK